MSTDPHCGGGAFSAVGPVVLAAAIGVGVSAAYVPATTGAIAIAPILGIGSFGMSILLFLLSLLLAPLIVLAGIVLMVWVIGGQVLANLSRRIFPGLTNFVGSTFQTAGKAFGGLGSMGEKVSTDSQAIADMIQGIKDSQLLDDKYWSALPPVPNLQVDQIGGQIRVALTNAHDRLVAVKTDLDAASALLKAAGDDLQSKGRQIDPTLP